MKRKFRPTQRELPGWFGGIRTLLTRVGWWISIINFVLISRTAWEFTPLLNTVFFQSYWLFLFLGLGSILCVGMLVEYMFFLPSEMRFAQHQIAKGGRSPIYEKVKETSEGVEELKKRLKQIEKKLGVNRRKKYR